MPSAAELSRFAQQACEAAGLTPDQAKAVAEVLVEGDLMGHDTHGLALLTPYLDSLANGEMTTAGEPDILSSTPVAETWDGKKLPGPWLVRRAAERASAMAATLGLGAVSIRRSHHIGCLQAYLPPIVERGQVMLLASSDPSVASVAPFGGTRRLYTPNPLAAGWPSPDGPVMLDVSMSNTTNGMTARLRAEGRRFAHPWLLDGEGRPTDDPNAFWADPPGSLLPLGGVEAGHKGYALGLMIEMLTSALGGFGRADAPKGWGANVFVLVLDPARFGGAEAFVRETGWMAAAVHANPPAPGVERVRLPGERALARRKRQLAEGVTLHPSIPPALEALARRYKIEGLCPSSSPPGG
jgi:LDH2 family malate/lactate/ureidoglycolate dehydrogenase